VALQKFRSKTRLNSGRDEAGIYDISPDYVEKLWKDQDEKCFYSGIQMVTSQSDWKVSLERKNPSLGYIKNNIALCCSELNGNAKQWTQDKVINMLAILEQDVIYVDVNFDLVKTTQKIQEKILHTVVDDIHYYKCNLCRQTKSRDMFNATDGGCKACLGMNAKIRRDTPRGAIKQLICAARAHSKRRDTIERFRVKRDNTMDIDFEFLVELFRQQRGVCAYSGIPLTFEAKQDWQMSLERLDPLKGYTRDNVCLICLEFNTGDRTVMYKHGAIGNSSWNAEKFKHFVYTAKNKYCMQPDHMNKWNS